MLYDPKTGKKRWIELEKDAVNINAELQDGVSCSSGYITVEKIGPLVKVFGMVRVDFTCEKKTLLKISRTDGTLDGIDIKQNGSFVTYFTPCEAYRIARLNWVKSTDGKTIDLELAYIFDSDTGKRSVAGNYWLQLDGEYYAGE